MIDAATRELVRSRARRYCEYCGLHEDNDPLFAFHVEHIIPRQHGGSDSPSNLAYACHQDNLRKGPNLTGIDPVTHKLTKLFHPRRHKWAYHFRREGALLIGRTAIGRATIAVLGMNLPHRITLRAALLETGDEPRSDASR